MILFFDMYLKNLSHYHRYFYRPRNYGHKFINKQGINNISYKIIDGQICTKNMTQYLRKLNMNFYFALYPLRVYHRTSIFIYNEGSHQILNEIIIPPGTLINDDGHKLPVADHAMIISASIIRKVFGAINKLNNKNIYEYLPTNDFLVSQNNDLYDTPFFYCKEEALIEEKNFRCQSERSK